MGVERIAVAGAEMVEIAMPGLAERLYAEVGIEAPALARLFGKVASEAPAAVSEAAGAAPVGVSKGAEAFSRGLASGAGGTARTELNSFYAIPHNLSPEEEEAHMDRLMRALDDRTVGVPPRELANAGLGARLWQFGTAGGDVLRERGAAEATGQWSPELAKSRDWLSKAPQTLQELPILPANAEVGPVQVVHQGISTQFAAGPVGVALRTDNVATCAAIHCTDGVTQFLGHADGMVHHRAVTEALNAAGIDLNKARVTLMPGPLKSPVLETVLPAFINDAKVMSLRIIPFRGPAHGSVIAKDGELFIPK